MHCKYFFDLLEQFTDFQLFVMNKSKKSNWNSCNNKCFKSQNYSTPL